MATARQRQHVDRALGALQRVRADAAVHDKEAAMENETKPEETPTPDPPATSADAPGDSGEAKPEGDTPAENEAGSDR